MKDFYNLFIHYICIAVLFAMLVVTVYMLVTQVLSHLADKSDSYCALEVTYFDGVSRETICMERGFYDGSL